MHKKIICTVTNDLVSDQRMHRIATSLSKNEYDVILVGRKLLSNYDDGDLNYKRHRIKCIFSKGFLFYAEYNVRLFFYLMFHAFDIVNAVDLDTSLPVILVAKIKRKKAVLDAHEDFVQSPEIVKRPIIKKIWSSIETFTFRRADLIYTVSKSIAEKFSHRYSRTIGIVRNFPIKSDIENLVKSNSEHIKPIVLYQGALNIGRGIPQLLEAFVELDMELWLAGDGDIKEDILNQIQELQISDKVKYLGNLSPKALHKVTQQADFGVNLLEPIGDSYYFSLANKFFDYVMAEIPQICIDFPEYRRLNDDFKVAILIDNLNPTNIREHLQNLSVNFALIEELTANCQRAKKVWHWENEAKKLIDFYKTL